MKDAVYHICLQIEHLELNEKEVLRDEGDVEDDLDAGKDSEGYGTRDNYDRLVDPQGHLLG